MKKGCLVLLAAFVCACVILFAVIGMAFNSFNDSLSEKEIFRLVEKNIDVITEDIEEGDFENTLKIKGVQKVNESEGAIDFYCGGSGFGPSTSYSGFCYITDYEKPSLWFMVQGQQIAVDDEEIIYEQKVNGDNVYILKKIRGRFYYYNATF